MYFLLCSCDRIMHIHYYTVQYILYSRDNIYFKISQVPFFAHYLHLILEKKHFGDLNLCIELALFKDSSLLALTSLY